MTMFRIMLLGLAIGTAGCTLKPRPPAPTESAREDSGAARSSTPRGARIGASGFATITDAPPAAYTPIVPGDAPPLTPEHLAGHDQFRRASLFQNQVMDEVQGLGERLRRSERGNFVDLYYENEGEPHVVFRFLRDAETTLAKYSRHPRFRAVTARYSREELRAASDFMLSTFREDRVLQSVGIGGKRNRAEVEISVSAPEFRALVARKGVRIPDAVELRFGETQPASAANAPLAPDIARLVRTFPRSDRGFGALHAINSFAKVVLDDGCFRIAGGQHDKTLVLFPRGAQLFIDREGYLAYGREEAPGYARVGEELIFGGSIGEVKAPKLVGPIHAACGAGKVVAVTGAQSAAAERLQQEVTQNDYALRQFRQSYGMSEATARRVLERCKQRVGSGTCLLSPQPPPPPGGPSCPPGTKASFGMCRTPEGYIRPIPTWIEELMRD